MRPNSLYILVLNHLSLEDPESVYQWLDQLVSIFPQQENPESKGEGSTVIPVRNPHTQIDTPSRSEFEKLVRNYVNAERNRPEKLSADRINVCLKLRPVITVDLHPEHQNLDSLKQQIRDSLEGYVLPSYFELHDQLSQIVESWTESYVTKEEFFQRLLIQDEDSETFKRVNAIYQEYKQQGEEFTKNINKRTFIDEALMYLDHCGKLHYIESLGYIILDKDWVQRGLYGLLPPEDRNGLPAAQGFRKQLVTPHPDIGLPGIFTKQQAFNVLDAVVDADPSSNGSSGLETEALFKILCEDTLNLVMDLSAIFAKDHYFMPVYLEEAQLSAPQDGKNPLPFQLHNNLYTSHSCVVLQAQYWPPYLIYQHMAWASRSARDTAPRTHYRLLLNEPYQPQPHHYWLGAVGHPNLKVEVLFWNDQIWCFGYGRHRDDRAALDGFLEGVHHVLSSLLNKQIKTLDKINRYLPCPDCLEVLDKDTQYPEPEQILDKALGEIGLLLWEDVYSARKGEALKCPNHTSHRPSSENALSYLLNRNFPVSGGKSFDPIKHIKAVTALMQISTNLGLSLDKVSTGLRTKINSDDISNFETIERTKVGSILEYWINNTHSDCKRFRENFFRIEVIGRKPYKHHGIHTIEKEVMLRGLNPDSEAYKNRLEEYEKRACEARDELLEKWCMQPSSKRKLISIPLGINAQNDALIRYCDRYNLGVDWSKVEAEIKNKFPHYQ